MNRNAAQPSSGFPALSGFSLKPDEIKKLQAWEQGEGLDDEERKKKEKEVKNATKKKQIYEVEASKQKSKSKREQGFREYVQRLQQERMKREQDKRAKVQKRQAFIAAMMQQDAASRKSLIGKESVSEAGKTLKA